MPKIFGTRFWGFSPQDEPFVAFKYEGTRDRIIKTTRPGDMIVVLGTKTENTSAEDQGRLLGLVEFAQTSVFADDLVSDVTRSKTELFENSSFKWPYALPALRSWRFPIKPKIEDVIGRQLSMAAITDVDELSETEAHTILALERDEVSLPDTRAIIRARRLGRNEAHSNHDGLNHDPIIPPSEWSRTVSRTDGPTHTYVFRYGDSSVWKIGISKDIRVRQTALNFSNPEEITGKSWQPVYNQLFPTGSLAFEMEQTILAKLSKFRTRNERVVCKLDDIERAWFSYLSGDTDAS